MGRDFYYYVFNFFGTFFTLEYKRVVAAGIALKVENKPDHDFIVSYFTSQMDI